MNTNPSAELRRAFSRFERALAQHGRKLDKETTVEDKKAINEFNKRMSIPIPNEYSDAVLNCGFSANSGEPLFRGLPLVSPQVAAEHFLSDASPDTFLIDFPFFSFCESDGAGLFVNLSEGQHYDAALSYVAPGVEAVLQFKNIRSFFNALSECLEKGMSNVLSSPAYGPERLAQNAILDKYR